jgi:hypothetical protein
MDWIVISGSLIDCHSIIRLSTGGHSLRRVLVAPERVHHPYSMTPFTPFRRSWITFQQNLQNTSALSQFPSNNSPQSPLTDPFLVTIGQKPIEQSVNKNENDILVHKRVTASVSCFNSSDPQIPSPPTMFSHTQCYPNFT